MNQRGFTLWELLVAMLIVGVVMGIGVPNFSAFVRNGDMAAAVNGVVSALHLSRTEAVKRQLPVTLCGSSTPLAAAPACDGGTGGYFAFIDVDDTDGDLIADGDGVFDAGEEILLQRDRPAATITTSVNPGTVSVTYRPDGFIDADLNPFNTLLFCDDRGNRNVGNGDSSARVVFVSPTGRPQLLRTMAAVTDAATATGGACP
jgi:type IV fimbrial biogenesis protein FimT